MMGHLAIVGFRTSSCASSHGAKWPLLNLLPWHHCRTDRLFCSRSRIPLIPRQRCASDRGPVPCDAIGWGLYRISSPAPLLSLMPMCRPVWSPPRSDRVPPPSVIATAPPRYPISLFRQTIPSLNQPSSWHCRPGLLGFLRRAPTVMIASS